MSEDADMIVMSASRVEVLANLEGEPQLRIVTSDGLSWWEAIGLLTAALDMAKAEGASAWEECDDPDE